MKTLFCSFLLLLACLLAPCLHAQDDKAKTPEPPKVPRPCYESLLKLDPVKYDTTESKVPYQTFLFRFQREYMVVVADTNNFYSFNYKRVRQNGVKVDSLTANSLAFDLSVCKLLDIKELTLKEKKRKIGDLEAPHYYTFSRKQQRLYASMRAVETGRARTFVGKSLAELKEIPQIFSFIKAKPNEKLQAQMQAMKDQAKKMKEEMKKVKDQAAKVEETMAKLQEQKKKMDEELAKLKKEKEDKDKKEQEKENALATKETDKNNPTTAKNNPKDNKNNPKDNKNNPKDNKNNLTNTKDNKTGKDSTNAPKLTKQELMVKEMDRLVREIDLMGNIDELKIKKEQLLAQKNDFENPNTKANGGEPKTIDHEKRKAEILAKLHEIDDLLKEIGDDSSNDIISKRKVIKDKQRYLKNVLSDMEKEKEKSNSKPQ